jgi:hypothetical protein
MMRALLEDHIWALVLCFVVAVAAYTVMVLAGFGEQGTLLRSVILTLGGSVAGYAVGRKV